jgi:hypothetical protein
MATNEKLDFALELDFDSYMAIADTKLVWERPKAVMVELCGGDPSGTVLKATILVTDA